MQIIEYEVRHASQEYFDYMLARFDDKHTPSISFHWKGHRWSYRYTDFDDEGNFDVIYRKVNPKQSTPPPTTEYIKKTAKSNNILDHIEVPASVISASLIVSGFFETLGIKNWELGGCRNRF